MSGPPESRAGALQPGAGLPNRRPNRTVVLDDGGRRWSLGVGFDRQGRAREVFLTGVKSGAELEGLVDDACVLASLLLQAGETAAHLAARLGRAGDPGKAAEGVPISVIGMALERAAATERDDGPALAAAHCAVFSELTPVEEPKP